MTTPPMPHMPSSKALKSPVELKKRSLIPYGTDLRERKQSGQALLLNLEILQFP